MCNLENIKDYFNKAALNWDDSNSDVEGAETICNLFHDLIKNKEILDVGCGTGVLYENLTSNGAEKITGIDISEEMIKVASAKYPKGKFICENILTWETEHMFDTIIMYNVYPHLNNKDLLVKKIYNLLNNNGNFIVAHGASRDKINSHHKAHALKVSQKLLSADDEAELWKNYFTINFIKDDDVYYFSGTKKLNN